MVNRTSFSEFRVCDKAIRDPRVRFYMTIKVI